MKATRLKSGKPPIGAISTFSFFGDPSGTFEFNDCIFYVGYFAGGGGNSVYHPGKTTFNNCSFIATEASKKQAFISAFPYIYWAGDYSNQTLTFTNCNFSADNSVDTTVPKFGVKYGATDADTKNNQIIFDNCTFADSIDSGVAANETGGKLIFSNSVFNVACRNIGSQTFPIYLKGSDNTNNWDVTINNCTFNTPQYIFIQGYSDKSYPCTRNFLRQGNIKINKYNNNIGSSYGLLNNNYLGLTANSIMRVIEDIGAPDNTPGFKNVDGTSFDQYKDMTDLKNPKYYKCINMNPYTWTQYNP